MFVIRGTNLTNGAGGFSVAVAVFVAWVAAMVLYAQSLFVEKAPVSERNREKRSPLFQKSIVVVVDGLRADAMYETATKSLYHGNFKRIKDIPSEDIYKAVSIADLPTGTAMRVFSVFSGVPTTLLCAQKSFKQQECTADNFVSQVVGDGRSFVFFGDETWTYIFPEVKRYAEKTYHPYGLVSFATESELMDKALKALKTKDLVVIHLISPDSYGHAYTTNSPQVKTALKMADSFIYSLYQEMGKDGETLIAVLSDHGVNDDGSHGGTSFKERAASLLLIGKGVSADKSSSTSEAREVYQTYAPEAKQLNIAEPVNVVSQNDILPTLCALIGLPTPYNAPGTLIPGVLPEEKYRDLHLQEISRKEAVLALLLQKTPVPAQPRKPENAQNPENPENTSTAASDLVKESDRLGRQIHALFHTSSVPGMIFSVGVMFLCVFVQGWVVGVKIFSPLMLLSYLAIFMVAHSVFSIIHEDVISLLICFGIAVFGPGSVLGSVFGSGSLFWQILALPGALMVGKFPLHSEDRFRVISWIGKAPLGTESLVLSRFFLVAAFVFVISFYSKKFQIRKGVRGSRPVTRTVAALCGHRLFSEKVVHGGCCVLLFLAPEVLPVLLYSPWSAMYMVLVFCPLVKGLACLEGREEVKGVFCFFLLKMMFFATGHNHNLSSINWEAAFLFTEKSVPGVSAALVLADVFLPCLYAAWVLGPGGVGVWRVVVLLQGVCTTLCCCINFWFMGQSLMWFIFSGRTIFEGGFLFVCYLFYLVGELARAFGKRGAWSPNHLPTSRQGLRGGV
ncbi:phosphatidylinositol glycan, class O [Nematocida displodere]|uniref:Phosphatidylinositol glycan, class O n=1 Tax=Nematocida displodere TaxID=1805483 RepID=A0A177EJZ9_9MICR|nr:phosphatidylinositol glycan, class O [Nematocida displodere]